MKLEIGMKIGIIGGKGKTGSQFAGLFRKLGFRVIVSDVGTKLSNEDVAVQSDILVFSVPLHLSEKVMRDMSGKARKGQLVLDVSSLKERQVKAMNCGKAEVVGMHPLFGPSKKKFDGLSIVLCPGKCAKFTVVELEKLFKRAGMKITIMTPKEHDKLMAVVQVIPHLKAILAGEMFKNLGVNPEKPYNISTPIYKLELAIIGRIFSQDGELYSSIIADNPHTLKVLAGLKKAVSDYERAVKRRDAGVLVKRFNGVKKFLGKFSDKAFKRSEDIINHIQKWD